MEETANYTVSSYDSRDHWFAASQQYSIIAQLQGIHNTSMIEYVDLSTSQHSNTICSDGNEGKWGNASRNVV